MNEPEPASRMMDNSDETSLSLIDLAKARDDEAWRRLVNEYGPLVHGWCLNSHVSPQDAPDVVQEVLQSVARSLDTFHRDQPGDSFRKWLRTITSHKVSDHLRRMRSQPVGRGGTTAWIAIRDEADPNPEPLGAQDTPIDRSDTSAALARPSMQALEAVRRQVKPQTWDAFWRTAVENEPPVDVAKQLNLSVASVYQARSRVLAKLRAELAENNPPLDSHGEDPSDGARRMS
jgi:RNA polymerase sigma-70 factor (ECF subfamily)